MRGAESGSGDSKLPVSITLIILASILLPIANSFAVVKGEPRLESRDFGVLEELSDLLDERSEILKSSAASSEAGPVISEIRESVRQTDNSSPIGQAEDVLQGASFVGTKPLDVVHPRPYEFVLGSESSPGFVENIWQTMINITDYAIWTQYTDVNGNVLENVEVVGFTASLISILLPNTDALLHAIDVNGDGIDDIQVGLKLAVSASMGDGWGIEDGTLWIEPGIEYSVREIGNSGSQDHWLQMDSLQVSILKAFTYSDSGTLLNLGQGESYVWIVDSGFKVAPKDFQFQVGIERLFFDLGGTAANFALDLIAAIADPFGIITPPSESGLTFAAISSPYALRFENSGQESCPDRYDPVELYVEKSSEISCGVSAGLGYFHFSAPDDDGEQELLELAYIDARFHPNGNSRSLPSSAEIVIRTEGVLPESSGIAGDRSLTTIEYWADRRADVHLHFHEDRSGEIQDDGSFGNITNSEGWFRGMPEGSLESNEIDRIFRLLGSADESVLPGKKPDELGLIIGIKNFTRDSSQNVDDPTLPINPANPPESLIVLRSVQPLEMIDYTSWFSRQGSSEDHRRIHINANSIPSAVAVFGSFGLGDSTEDGESLDSGENIDFISKILDSVILNLVDIFLDVGTVLNDVPSTVVDVISGGTGSGGLAGGSINLMMTDNWAASRSPMSLSSAVLQIGSSDHPVIPGDHLLLAQDRGLGADFGSLEPLVPVAASIRFSGLQSFSVSEFNETETVSMALNTQSDNPLALVFVNHETGNLSGSSHQSVRFSDLPNSISINASSEEVEYHASSAIDTILYSGVGGNQKQAARISGFPSSFESKSGPEISWSTDTEISLIEAQLSDSDSPLTMAGDHFLFEHDSENGVSSLSARVSGLKEVGWINPQEEGAEGEAGMGTVFAKIGGGEPFSMNVGNAPTNQRSDLSVIAQIDPLPSSISLQVPTSSDSGASLDIPQLNSSEGLSGVALFIGGFSDLGRSVNTALAGLTTNISTGANSDESDFAFSIGLDADTEFDLLVEAKMGDNSIDEPDWVHGVSLNSAKSGVADGFHMRAWIPNLPPKIDLSVSRTLIENGQIWGITIGLDGWEPQESEFVISLRGVNGQDLFLTIEGLTVGTATSMLLDTEITSRTLGGITETSTNTLYSMSNSLDWFHALLIDRGSGTRTEMMVQDIPKTVEIQASIGTAISIDMTVPEQYRVDGLGVGSIMLQQMQWMDGSWWPATLFLSKVPGSMNLTTEPDLNFDITENLAFQGMPILDYSASEPGMSLYIEASGRAVNTKGDIVMMAEGMADRLAIKPTESYGLNVRSGGDGVGLIYVRASEIPTLPPVILDEIEVLGEDLKSATIHIREIVGPYSLIEIDDVRSGRVIVSARASAEIGENELDLRGVLLDAQSKGGVPSGTTLGVNGLASDMTLAGMVPGLSGPTSHIMAPEPLSSGVLTIIATLGGFD
tara:strand:+ start:197 stop:4561 length:4365 start_codon:yes stop_codon:yes gene_type:complete